MTDRVHQRKVIRETVKTLLLNNTSCEGRVFVNRYTPLWQVELPCICVYFKKDTPQPRPRGSYFYRRNLYLVIEIMVAASPAMDDQIDDISLEVEDIILPNLFLIGPYDENENASFQDLQDTDISLSADGQKLFGSGRITFLMEYDQEFPERKDGVADFKTALNKMVALDPVTEGLPGATTTEVFKVQE